MRGIWLVLMWASTIFANPQYCLEMDHPNSTFMTTSMTLQNLNLDMTRAVVDFAQFFPPTISTCLGSIDINQLLAIAFSVLKESSCSASYSMAMTWKTDVAAAVKNTSVNGLSDSVFRAVCAPFPHLIPCLDNFLLPNLLPFFSSQPCCAPALSDFQAMFGQAVDAFISKSVHSIADVVCSTQSPGFHNQTSQTCGFALLESFRVSSSPAAQLTKILQALQIPNNQGEAAMTGRIYKNTKNQTAPAIVSPPLLPGSCVIPVDSLIGWIRQWPILQLPVFGLDLQPLFSDGGCIPGGVFTSLFGSPVPGLSILVNNNTACFHLANGYSTSSNLLNTPTLKLFTSTLITSQAITKAPDGTTPQSPSPTPKPTLGGENMAFASSTLWLYIFIFGINTIL